MKNVTHFNNQEQPTSVPPASNIVLIRLSILLAATGSTGRALYRVTLWGLEKQRAAPGEQIMWRRGLARKMQMFANLQILGF